MSTYKVNHNSSIVELSCKIGAFKFNNEEIISSVNVPMIDELALYFPNIFIKLQRNVNAQPPELITPSTEIVYETSEAIDAGDGNKIELIPVPIFEANGVEEIYTNVPDVPNEVDEKEEDEVESDIDVRFSAFVPKKRGRKPKEVQK